MNNLQTIGRVVYAIPFGIFGLSHFMMANAMKGMVPAFIPGGVLWVYLTGLALIAATISIITTKQIYLTALLLAALLIVFVLTIWIPGMFGGNQMAMSGLMKDTALAGSALLIAGLYKNSEQ